MTYIFFLLMHIANRNLGAFSGAFYTDTYREIIKTRDSDDMQTRGEAATVRARSLTRVK